MRGQCGAERRRAARREVLFPCSPAFRTLRRKKIVRFCAENRIKPNRQPQNPVPVPVLEYRARERGEKNGTWCAARKTGAVCVPGAASGPAEKSPAAGGGLPAGGGGGLLWGVPVRGGAGRPAGPGPVPAARRRPDPAPGYRRGAHCLDQRPRGTVHRGSSGPAGTPSRRAGFCGGLSLAQGRRARRLGGHGGKGEFPAAAAMGRTLGLYPVRRGHPGHQRLRAHLPGHGGGGADRGRHHHPGPGGGGGRKGRLLRGERHQLGTDAHRLRPVGADQPGTAPDRVRRDRGAGGGSAHHLQRAAGGFYHHRAFYPAGGAGGGRIRVNDPNSPQNSEKLWAYDTLEPQIRNLWAFSPA